MLYSKLYQFEKWIFDALAVVLVSFYAYSAVFQPAATQYHRGVYVFITYILVFMVYRLKSPIGRVFDYVLIAASIASVGYWMHIYEAINYRAGAETLTDKYIAMIGVLIGIEVARRVVGNVFVILGAIMLLFGVFGDSEYVPEFMSHAGDAFPDLATSLFYKGDGVFGIMANVLASYIVLFVFFGAFLEKSGAQRFFVDFSLAAVGHKIGGPGKVSVIASGFFGSVSGSAIANTVSTGAFTIPMMKKAGFKPHTAGGIEPAASIGGMFMPPIMGAGGFLMAEYTGLPYSQIMLVAMFPAFMYFFSVYVMVHYEAKRNNIIGEKYKYTVGEVLKKQWYYTIPLIMITALMLKGYSPSYVAVLGIASCIMVSWIRKDTRMGPKELLEASRAGAEASLTIGATVGVIGIIIGVLTYSGLMLTFADAVIALADGKLFLTILLIALASLVMGMGVPVTAAYAITAGIAVPTLTHLGVNELAAHMVVYWLSQDSNITPPVCIAAFAGAAIAKANMWKTAFSAFKFAKFLYLGPFLFGYVPGFSLNGSATDIAVVFVLITFGTWAYSWLLSGIWIDWFKKEKKAA